MRLIRFDDSYLNPDVITYLKFSTAPDTVKLDKPWRLGLRADCGGVWFEYFEKEECMQARLRAFLRELESINDDY